MANESLIVVGVLLLVLGVVLLFLPFVCLLGGAMAIIGFILLLVGAVSEGPRPTYGYTPYPPAYAPAYGPAYGAAPPAGPVAAPHCPRCGNPLTFVHEYQRWYCPTERVYPWG